MIRRPTRKFTQGRRSGQTILTHGVSLESHSLYIFDKDAQKAITQGRRLDQTVLTHGVLLESPFSPNYIQLLMRRPKRQFTPGGPLIQAVLTHGAALRSGLVYSFAPFEPAPVLPGPDISGPGISRLDISGPIGKSMATWAMRMPYVYESVMSTAKKGCPWQCSISWGPWRRVWR